MTGMTDFITTARWEDVWTIWFVLVDDAYQALERRYGRWRRTGPAPVFHDSEVITVALIIDTWFHGHEALGLAFLRQYHPTLFPHLPSDGWFNQRRTRLGPLIDQIRQVITQQYGGVSGADPDRLADSAPIPVATYQRARANRTVTGSAYFGVMNRRRAKLFGFRLHLTTTTHGVVDAWVLAPAAIHDSQALPALVEDAACQALLGDGAYHNPTAAPVLAARQVAAPPRRDSRKREPWPAELRRWVGKVRRRIETALSVLTVVFNIECPHARSLQGLVCRISTRLLAYNLCFITGALLAQQIAS
ncbi:MAG: IS982 family transposase [Roseiflexaceae bacterium]|nr:IS982 family transposase [Roseiflexaceae bacterium]